MERENPNVQELVLWGLAAVAIALLLKAAFWPHSAAPEPTPQREVPQPKREDLFKLASVSIVIGRDYRRNGLLDSAE